MRVLQLVESLDVGGCSRSHSTCVVVSPPRGAECFLACLSQEGVISARRKWRLPGLATPGRAGRTWT